MRSHSFSLKSVAHPYFWAYNTKLIDEAKPQHLLYVLKPGNRQLISLPTLLIEMHSKLFF